MSWRDCTTIAPVSAYHRASYAETYSRFKWIPIKRTLGVSPTYSYYISNAPESTPLRLFVWLTLQRHLSVLTKSTHVESRFCGRSRQVKAAFCTPVNPCVRSVCSRSVVVGLNARDAILLTFNIIRPIAQRIMVTGSYTNVNTVRSISPRQKIPSWKV